MKGEEWADFHLSEVNSLIGNSTKNDNTQVFFINKVWLSFRNKHNTKV